MAHFKLDLEVYADGPTLDEMKQLLGEFAADNDLEIEGSIVRLGKREELERDYIAI